jgi:hypothetical protein
MAKRYESEAQVVIDGVEKPVYARFTVYADGPGLKQWHGAIGSDDDSLAWDVLNAKAVLLRMPDGKEASIVATGPGGEGGIGFTGADLPRSDSKHEDAPAAQKGSGGVRHSGSSSSGGRAGGATNSPAYCGAGGRGTVSPVCGST